MRIVSLCSGFLVLLAPLVSSAQSREPLPVEPYELIKPYERSDLELHLAEISPVYPIPGENLKLSLHLVNNQDFTENHLEIRIYRALELIAVEETSLDPLEKKSLQLHMSAPEKEGLCPYTAELHSSHPWIDVDLSDNSVTFDLVTSWPADRSNYSIRGLSLIHEPNQVPGILVDAEHSAGVASPVPLELKVNQSEVFRTLVYSTESTEQQKIFFPMEETKQIREVEAFINPRFSGREVEEADNRLYRDFRPSRDLCVEDLSIHAPEFAEEEKRLVTVNFTIRNAGRQVIREGFSTRISASLFENEEGPVHFISSDEPLPPGEALYVSQELEGIPDEFYIRVVVDVNQEILEEDKENNVASVYYKNPLPNVGRWYSIGPDRILDNGLNATGRLWHIAVDPTDSQVIFTGGESGSGGNGTGVWKTKDGGKNWYPITENLGHQMVKALAIDPKFSDRIILGTTHTHRDSSILWESVNSGVTWKKLALLGTRLRANTVLLFHPVDPTIYLNSLDGIYKSGNDGKTWTRTLSGKISDMVMDPKSPSTLYAVFKDNSGFHLYRSQQSGNSGSWNSLTGCGKKQLPVPSSGNMDLAISGSKLYVSYMVDTVFSIYASTKNSCPSNQGPKWDKVLETSINTKLTHLEADPNNPKNLYAYWDGPSNVWVSHDGGKSIKKVSGKVPHVDTHGFGFDPQDSKIVYVLSDGGIYKSTDTGKDGTWSFVGEGLRNAEIYYMAGIQSDKDMLIAGTQDNGNIMKQANSRDWKVIPGAGGDGSWVAMHPKDKTEFYTMHQHGTTLRKHSKGGVKRIGCGFDPCAYQHNFFYTIVPDDPQRLLLYYNDTLWTAKNPTCQVFNNCHGSNGRSLGSTNVWSVLWKTPANSGSIKRMAIDDKLDIFYAGTSSGLVYYSEDRGSTWDTVATLTFRSSIHAMALNPDKPQNLYVSYARDGTHRIYLYKRSRINQTLSFSATDITFGLPNGLRALTLAVDPISSYVLYAGTKDGVYRGQSFDQGTTWIWKAYNKGMGKGILVSELLIQQKTGLLRAATKGRSVYSIRNYHDDIAVEVSPGFQNVEPGHTCSYTVKVRNKGSSTTSYHLWVKGLEDFQYTFGTSTLTVAPGKEGSTSLSVPVPKCFTPATWNYVFTVSATKKTDVKAYGQSQAQLRVVTLNRQLQPDSQENNNQPGLATPLKLILNQNAPWNQTPVKVQNLNLHNTQDVDYFKVSFSSNAKADCAGSGPRKFGSFMSAFAPKYSPGNISLAIKEEFCRPLDVFIFSYDSANTGKVIPWGNYTTSGFITINCPSQVFKSSEFYVKIWRSAGDEVNYDLELTLNPWVITLGKPLYEVGDLRYNLPPHFRDWVPKWRWFDFREQLELFEDRIRELRELENLYTEGQVLKLRADLEIAVGNLDEGEAILNHSQELFERMGALSAMGDVFASRATLASLNGRRDEALEFIHRAMDHHMESGNRDGMLEDVRQLMSLGGEPGSFGHALGFVREIYHRDGMEDNPEAQMESLQILSELLLRSREIEGAVAGFVLIEQMANGLDIPQDPGLVEQGNTMIHLLGKDGFNELKAQLNYQADEVLELKVGHILGED